MSNEIMRALGRIEGELKGVNGRLDAQGKKLDSVDARLRNNEVASARHGLVSGGLAGVGITLIIEGVKQAFRNGA